MYDRDLGKIDADYDVWEMIDWYWDKHSLDTFHGDWMEIAGEAEFEFRECNVTDPFWEHHINNHFGNNITNEKVMTSSPSHLYLVLVSHVGGIDVQFGGYLR